LYRKSLAFSNYTHATIIHMQSNNSGNYLLFNLLILLSMYFLPIFFTNNFFFTFQHSFTNRLLPTCFYQQLFYKKNIFSPFFIQFSILFLKVSCRSHYLFIHVSIYSINTKFTRISKISTVFQSLCMIHTIDAIHHAWLD